jgi:hypothetical protein
VSYSAGERILLLEEMAREVFGYTGPRIIAAPVRHRLKMFGGDLSIEDFRLESQSMCATAVLSQPLLTFPEVYERHALHEEQPAAKVQQPKVSKTKSEQTERLGVYGDHLRRNSHIKDDAVVPGTLSVFMKKKPIKNDLSST